MIITRTESRGVRGREEGKKGNKLSYHVSANPLKNLNVVDDFGAKYNVVGDFGSKT